MTADAIKHACDWSEADAPILWLLGKTQSGKTSIVAEITGQGYEQIGSGYRAMTREARLYAYPEPQPVLRLLDTRGLSDCADYDAGDDLKTAQNQAHLIIAVMRVDDLDQAPILTALQQAYHDQPRRPLIIAQTTLHRVYQRHERHIEPYPFDGSDADRQRPEVPDALGRAMLAQRQLVRNVLPSRCTPRFVPLDFTRPEQGIVPSDYGVARFWDVLEAEVPDLVLRLKQVSAAPSLHEQIRRRIIVPWAVAASATSAIPAPVLGGLGSASLQAAMVSQIAYRFGFTKRLDLWGEFVAALGTGFTLGFAGQWAVQQGLKLGLGWGTALVASWTFVMTWGIGEAALYYFSERKAGHQPDREALREHYRAGLRQARHYHTQRKQSSHARTAD